MSDDYPRTAKDFQGLSIWFDPKSGEYYTNLCEHVKRGKNVEAVNV